MFNGTYEKRLAAWQEFRRSIEDDDDPLRMVINHYKNSPYTRIQADPWDKKTWPSPWEIIEQNLYCDFVKILAICYSLQLTTRFSGSQFEINIVQDKQKSLTKYTLNVDEYCIGYDDDEPILRSELPKSLVVEMSYTMPNLQ